MAELEVVTFGCRLNAFESAVIRRQAEAAGLAAAMVGLTRLAIGGLAPGGHLSLLALAAFAAGLLVIGSGVLPRWLGWVSILAGILFFLQGFGLGGVIASFGLVLDLVAFVLFLIFVLVSSVIMLTRKDSDPNAAVGIK